MFSSFSNKIRDNNLSLQNIDIFLIIFFSFSLDFPEKYAAKHKNRQKDLHTSKLKQYICKENNLTMTKRQETIIPEDVLDSLTPFSELLTAEERKTLMSEMIVRKFKKNEQMYSEGDVPQYFHFILSGKVKIYKQGVGGRNQIIHILRPSEVFGYRAYLANENYITSAAAFESTMLCMIPVELFTQIVYSNQRLCNYFVKLFASEMGVVSRHIVSLTQKHLRGRIAESLLVLKDTYGLDEDEHTIAANISRSDLADLSNMTTSNAIRTLSAFCNEHILEVDRRRIRIIDEEQLKKISKIG